MGQRRPLRGLRCSGLKYALCRFRSLAPQRCYFDLTHLLIVDEEIFDLLQYDRRQICQFPHLGEEQRRLSDRNDAIIAFTPRIAL